MNYVIYITAAGLENLAAGREANCWEFGMSTRTDLPLPAGAKVVHSGSFTLPTQQEALPVALSAIEDVLRSAKESFLATCSDFEARKQNLLAIPFSEDAA